MIKPGDEPFPPRDSDDERIPFDAVEFDEPFDPAPMIDPIELPSAYSRRPRSELTEPVDPALYQLTHSSQEITDTIWFLLSARCAHCRTVLDTDDIKGLRDQDPLRWARVTAVRAIDAGWMAAASEALLFCPDCSGKARS